ncbi:MAG: hypothetical protein HXX81_00960, partial [Campylobacterales bacterium]|nr:hypothetical protein [Campylobacterales bacterium]
MKVFLKVLVALIVATIYANAWNIGSLATGQTTSYQNYDDGYYKAGIDRNFTREDSSF